MEVGDPDEVKRWYDAARKWVGILRRPELEYWEQLRPGRPLSMGLPILSEGGLRLFDYGVANKS